MLWDNGYDGTSGLVTSTQCDGVAPADDPDEPCFLFSITADDYNVIGVIEQIRIKTGFWNPGIPDGGGDAVNLFDICFWTDGGGLPGALIESFVIDPSNIDWEDEGGFGQFRFDLSLPGGGHVASGLEWMSITPVIEFPPQIGWADTDSVLVPLSPTQGAFFDGTNPLDRAAPPWAPVDDVDAVKFQLFGQELNGGQRVITVQGTAAATGSFIVSVEQSPSAFDTLVTVPSGSEICSATVNCSSGQSAADVAGNIATALNSACPGTPAEAISSFNTVIFTTTDGAPPHIAIGGAEFGGGMGLGAGNGCRVANICNGSSGDEACSDTATSGLLIRVGDNLTLDPILEGSDILTTTAGTQVKFSANPLPAGTFGANSEELSSDVALNAIPLNSVVTGDANIRLDRGDTIFGSAFSADFDGDGDVDAEDVGFHFTTCVVGAGDPACIDFDGDGMIADDFDDANTVQCLQRSYATSDPNRENGECLPDNTARPQFASATLVGVDNGRWRADAPVEVGRGLPWTEKWSLEVFPAPDGVVTAGCAPGTVADPECAEVNDTIALACDVGLLGDDSIKVAGDIDGTDHCGAFPDPEERDVDMYQFTIIRPGVVVVEMDGRFSTDPVDPAQLRGRLVLYNADGTGAPIAEADGVGGLSDPRLTANLAAGTYNLGVMTFAHTGYVATSECSGEVGDPSDPGTYEVCLSLSRTSSITVTDTNDDSGTRSGTFDASLLFQPIYIFTKVADPNRLVFVDSNCSGQVAQSLEGDDVPWVSAIIDPDLQEGGASEVFVDAQDEGADPTLIPGVQRVDASNQDTATAALNSDELCLVITPPSARKDCAIDGVTQDAVSFDLGAGIAIPDDDATGISDAQAVGGSPVTDITEVRLMLNIEHTFNDDLIVTLDNGATSVDVIVNSNGGADGGDGMDITLDDGAATNIQNAASGGMQLTGTFAPANPLSAFNGMSANGTWTLSVADTVAADSGTLLSWGLEFDQLDPVSKDLPWDVVCGSWRAQDGAILLSHPFETAPTGTIGLFSDLDGGPIIADNFTLSADATITDVHWRGSYSGTGANCLGDDDFTLRFHNSVPELLDCNIETVGELPEALTGSYCPIGSFLETPLPSLDSATPDGFQGASAAGNWTLTVVDNGGAGDTGTLVSWGVVINDGETSASATPNMEIPEDSGCAGGGPPVLAEPCGGVGITSTVSIGPALFTNDVNVDVTIDHTFNGDLSVWITHDTTTVVLMDRPFDQAISDTTPGMDITFDDDAPAVEGQNQPDPSPFVDLAIGSDVVRETHRRIGTTGTSRIVYEYSHILAAPIPLTGGTEFWISVINNTDDTGDHGPLRWAWSVSQEDDLRVASSPLPTPELPVLEFSEPEFILDMSWDLTVPGSRWLVCGDSVDCPPMSASGLSYRMDHDFVSINGDQFKDDPSENDRNRWSRVEAPFKAHDEWCLFVPSLLGSPLLNVIYASKQISPEDAAALVDKAGPSETIECIFYGVAAFDADSPETDTDTLQLFESGGRLVEVNGTINQVCQERNVRAVDPAAALSQQLQVGGLLLTPPPGRDAGGAVFITHPRESGPLDALVCCTIDGLTVATTADSCAEWAGTVDGGCDPDTIPIGSCCVEDTCVDDTLTEAKCIAMGGGQWTVGLACDDPEACSEGCACPGDFDGDGDVDLVDFGNFSLCFTGPGASFAKGCDCGDFEGDGDIDLVDFGSFSLSFTGPGGVACP
jgi:subtilisin-like proprotein convertase family protein